MYYTFYNSTVYKSEVEFDRNDIEGCGAVEVYKDPEYTKDDGNITDSGKKGYVQFAIVDDHIIHGNSDSIVFVPIGEQEPSKIVKTKDQVKGVYSFHNGLLYNENNRYISTVDLGAIIPKDKRKEDYFSTEILEVRIAKPYGKVKVRENQIILSGDVDRPDLFEAYTSSIFTVEDMDYILESSVLNDGNYQAIFDLVSIELNQFKMRKLIEDIPVALDNIPTADDENKNIRFRSNIMFDS